jgi:probable phosphoglycerate mutase
VTTLLLIRHALTDAVGHVLSGRSEGVALNAAGRAQAEELARRLEKVELTAIYSSPLERAVATAEALARGRALRVQTLSALTEVDFGEWTGRTLASLEGDPAWQLYNTQRGRSAIPGGEAMLAIQARVIAELERLHYIHPDGSVAVVSHGDVLRAALLHYLGVALDLFERIEVEPASLSVVRLGPAGPRIARLNDTGGLAGSGEHR